MIEFLQIFVILTSGIAIGYILRELRSRQTNNQKVRVIETVKAVTQLGEVDKRITEWPMDAGEYLAYVLENKSFKGSLTVKDLEDHLNAFAVLMTTRQKRDFMKMLRQMKSGEIIHKLKVGGKSIILCLAISLTCFSCKKDTIPPKAFFITLDGQQIEMPYASIGQNQGVYYLSAATSGSESSITCNLGTTIKEEYSIHQSPFFGYQDSVVVETGGVHYMPMDDLGAFNITISGADQERTGNFSGKLISQSNDTLSVTGLFINI